MIKCGSLNYGDFVSRDTRAPQIIPVKAAVALQIETIYPQAQKYMFYRIFQEKTNVLAHPCKKNELTPRDESKSIEK